MNDQVRDMGGKRLAQVTGLALARIVGDGDVAQRQHPVWIRLRLGRRSTLFVGGEILRGPTQHVGCGRLVAERLVEHRDPGVVAGEHRKLYSFRIKPEVRERLAQCYRIILDHAREAETKDATEGKPCQAPSVAYVAPTAKPDAGVV